MERWVNKESDRCSFRIPKQQSTLFVWPQSFPNLNHMFIIVTMTTRSPNINEIANCNPNRNVSLNLTKSFVCLNAKPFP